MRLGVSHRMHPPDGFRAERTVGDNPRRRRRAGSPMLDAALGQASCLWRDGQAKSKGRRRNRRKITSLAAARNGTKNGTGA